MAGEKLEPATHSYSNEEDDHTQHWIPSTGEYHASAGA